jgi:hypothetical protein
MAETKITLPPGMSKEEFDKLFATFQKQRTSTKGRDKAVREATKHIISKYKSEYDAELAKLMPKA